MRTSRLAPTSLAALVLLVACNDSSSQPSATSDPTTTTIKQGGGATSRPNFKRFAPFDSCNALLGYLKDAAAENVTPYGLGNNQFWLADGGGRVALESSASTAAAAATTAVPASSKSASPVASGANQDSSGTNTQEAGVDEGDVAENDGRYVFSTGFDGTLRIVDTQAGKQVAKMSLPQGAQQLVLDGDRLVVVTSGWSDGPVRIFGGGDGRMGWGGTSQGATTVTVIDIAKRDAPKATSSTVLEGDAVAVRASGGTLRIVMRSGFGERLDFVAPSRPGTSAEEKALKFNKEVIADSTIDDWMPRSSVDGAKVKSALSCDQIGRPEQFSGLGMTWVASIDLAKAAAVTGSGGVVAEAGTVYSSEASLYVGTTQWQRNNLDPDVRKIRPEPPTTMIHQFGLDGDSASYQASGSIEGTLLNQFSMSEHEGILRVASTLQDWGGFNGRAGSESSVFTLKRSGSELNVVGSVSGLGKGEQIYAVRFLGATGYVVTFRQTDPLYVIDLRDPAKPTVSGELKIPGYSSYLHPVGDGRLLGIGQAATDQGRVQGTQLSLFDVSDPTKPTRLANLEFGQGNSGAEYDHKAFLYWAKTGQVVVPFQSYAGEGSGVIVSQLRGDVLTEKKRLSLPDVNVTGGDTTGKCDGPAETCPSIGFYHLPIDRSMVVGGRLVLISQAGIAIHALDTLERTGWATFN